MNGLEDRALYAMICYFGKDTRRIHHALKVYGTVLAIASEIGLTQREREALGLAAILHDIGIPESERKYRSAAAKYQQAEGPPVARGILEELHCEPSLSERVCWLIAHHHTYGAADGMDFQILIEADLIVNMAEGEFDGAQAIILRTKYFKTAEGTKMAEEVMRAGDI